MKLKPPPFKVGQVVEYIGDRKQWDANINPTFYKGIRVQIVEAYAPKKGLGIIGRDEDGDFIKDYDEDGYSVYESRNGRKIIWAEKKNEWKVIDN